MTKYLPSMAQVVQVAIAMIAINAIANRAPAPVANALAGFPAQAA